MYYSYLLLHHLRHSAQEVQEAVAGGIEWLLRKREEDPYQFIGPRALQEIGAGQQAPTFQLVGCAPSCVTLATMLPPLPETANIPGICWPVIWQRCQGPREWPTCC